MNSRPFVSTSLNIFDENRCIFSPNAICGNPVMISQGHNRNIYDVTTTTICPKQNIDNYFQENIKQSGHFSPFGSDGNCYYSSKQQPNGSTACPFDIYTQKQKIPGGVMYIFFKPNNISNGICFNPRPNFTSSFQPSDSPVYTQHNIINGYTHPQPATIHSSSIAPYPSIMQKNPESLESALRKQQTSSFESPYINNFLNSLDNQGIGNSYRSIQSTEIDVSKFGLEAAMFQDKYRQNSGSFTYDKGIDTKSTEMAQDITCNCGVNPIIADQKQELFHTLDKSVLEKNKNLTLSEKSPSQEGHDFSLPKPDPSIHNYAKSLNIKKNNECNCCSNIVEEAEFEADAEEFLCNFCFKKWKKNKQCINCCSKL